MSYRSRQILGIIFALALLAVLEAALFSLTGDSFFARLMRGTLMPIAVFAAGCVIGMAWEYVGQCAFLWWRYPAVDRRPYLLAALPLLWGIFMLVMQDGYAIARASGLTPVLAITLSPLAIGFLIEGVNLYTKSWVYEGWAGSHAVLAIGWVLLLGTTFVSGFNLLFGSPFGF